MTLASGPAAETTTTRSLAQVLLDKGQALFTGRIDVVLGPWVGALHLTEGQIVDARVGPFAGEAALWRMLLPLAPRITVEPGRARTTAGAMLGRPDALLPRAAERIDLLERVAEKVGGLDRVWAIRFDALQARLETMPDGIHPVLRLLDGKRPVRQVVAECPVEDVLALRVLGKLLTEGVLVLPDARPDPRGTDIIDVEGGLEEALSAALAELSADDIALPAEQAIAPEPAASTVPPLAPAPAPSPSPSPSMAGGQPASAPQGAGPSSEPPGPMPSPSTTAAVAAGLAARVAAMNNGSLAQHLALPRPAPPVAGADDLRAWVGVEEEFFSKPPQAASAAPGQGAQRLPWALLAVLATVAVIVGVALGRSCG